MIAWVMMLAAATLKPAPASPLDARTEVRRVVEAENRMYATFDASVAEQVYAPDIRWQNPFGVRFTSEREVQVFLKRLFSKSGFRAAEEVKAPVITDINMLSADVAAAWSEESSTGQVRADGTAVGLGKSHVLSGLKRGARGWQITDELIMDEK